MRLPCEVVRDLLPLYAENMVSDKSRELTEEHLAECSSCRAELEAMNSQTPDVQFRMDTAQEFAKYEKKKNRRLGWKIAGITAGVVAMYFIVHIVLILGVVGLLVADYSLAKKEVDTDVSHYSRYMGENAEEKYRSKWCMDESIFPEKITDDMQVQEYKMVYYNPWDSQFLSYLTVTYSDEDYETELSRLDDCGITPYKGYYTVTGFAGDSDPIAMYADDYSGFVYAIHTPGRENTITYVELIFCNYFYDLDYKEYIPEEYLPLGFDATMDNPYQKQELEKS